MANIPAQTVGAPRSVRRLILSAGRACFVCCPGCYNFFGKSSLLTSTDTILRFLTQLVGVVPTITVGGGDPLTRPDILNLLRGIKALGFRLHMDTVGTSLLADAPQRFHGRDIVRHMCPAVLAGLVDKLGIPLDGYTNEMARLFRAGRLALFDEQIAIIDLASRSGLPVSINTVVHPANIDNLTGIADALAPFPDLVEWQLFQFMPIGPLGFRNRDRFRVDNADYDAAVMHLRGYAAALLPHLTLTAKTRAARKDLYLMIDTDGIAWTPRVTKGTHWNQADESPERTVVGDINRPEDYSAIVDFVSGLPGSNYAWRA